MYLSVSYIVYRFLLYCSKDTDKIKKVEGGKGVHIIVFENTCDGYIK